MKITDIKLHKVNIPLKRPFITALRTVNTLETNIIEIGTDEGIIGFGEASPTAAITGDTMGSIGDAIENYIFPSIKGMDVEEIEAIMQRINKALLKNTSAKAAVDMAIYDLLARHYKMPLYKYFGYARNEIESDITISVKEPEAMARDAEAFVREGYRFLKIKVGVGSEEDILRIKAINSAVGNNPGVRIRIDANQGWKPREAVLIIRRLEDMGYNIELVEQPVSCYDIEGLKFVTDNVNTPIMADEALFTPQDAIRILSLRAVDFINIKLMKTGGLYNALKICSIAESYGVECMIGSMLESAVGITAASHLACGRLCITRTDLDSSILLANNPVVGGVVNNSGRITLQDNYGLGINGIHL